jgi:hypothetical protein
MKDRRPFALGTTVLASKTRAQIEELATKHGATSFASASSGRVDGLAGGAARILFEVRGRRIRFEVNLSTDEAENRRRWRCLYMVMRAKFEAVADGLESFEEAFLSQTIVPGSAGETVAQWIGPQLEAAYTRGATMAPLLGDGR